MCWIRTAKGLHPWSKRRRYAPRMTLPETRATLNRKDYAEQLCIHKDFCYINGEGSLIYNGLQHFVQSCWYSRRQRIGRRQSVFRKDDVCLTCLHAQSIRSSEGHVRKARINVCPYLWSVRKACSLPHYINSVQRQMCLCTTLSDACFSFEYDGSC